jgi:hypothetical protein
VSSHRPLGGRLTILVGHEIRASDIARRGLQVVAAVVATGDRSDRYQSESEMTGQDTEQAVEERDRLTSRGFEAADFFCGVTLVGALITALAGAMAETLFLAVTVVAMLLLRRLRLPRALELSVAIGIVLQGWGNALLLFERIGWYDKAVHFLTPMLMVPSLYLLLARAGAVPSPWANGLRRGTLGVLVVTIALGIALAATWELVEGSADRLLGTSLAHGYFETIDDLYSSLLGSVAAGALLGWSVMAGGRDLAAQRVPAEALTERE